MFREGGAAVPNEFKGFSKLPEEVQMKMNPELAKKYQEGGPVFDPNNIANIVRFFRDNPGTTVEDYNKFFGTNLDPQEFGIFEKPAKSTAPYNFEEQVGTMGALRLGDQMVGADSGATFQYSPFGPPTFPTERADQQDLRDLDEAMEVRERGPLPIVAMQEGGNVPAGGIMNSSPAMDANIVGNMVGQASQAGFSDPEMAPNFEAMMDSVTGDEKSTEERRGDLATIVGQEDANQTPESVLTLVTPVVELALVDQGIGPMAQEQMNTPIEGDMGRGIMSMAASGNMGVGNEPPVNFKLGGEVRRRGDEDPVPVFEQGGPVQYFDPKNKNRVVQPTVGGITPLTSFDDITTGIQTDYQKLLPLFQKNMQFTDPDTRKKQLQSQILFDIANTALAFASPMEGEKAGLSPAQRLAMAAERTKLFPTIAARSAQAIKEKAAEEQAPKTAALTLAGQLAGKKFEATVGERKTMLAGGIDLAKTQFVEAKKDTRQVNSNIAKLNLEQFKANLVKERDAILASNDANKVKKANEFTLLLKDVDAEIAAASQDAAHEKEIEKINLNFKNKKIEMGIAQGYDIDKLELKQGFEVANIATKHANALTLQKDKQTFDKSQLETQIKSSEFIAEQNNSTKVAINDNNLVFKRERLAFDKKREANLVEFRKVSNNIKKSQIQINAGQLALNRTTEARKKAENARELLLKENKFEEAKAQNDIINAFKERETLLKERQQQLDQIQRFIDNALNKDKLAFQKEKVSLENSFRQQDLMFRKQVQQDLIFYRKEMTRLDQERIDNDKAFNLLDISYKNKKIALEKLALTNSEFGKNIEGVYTRVLNNASNLKKFADGTLDENTSLMMANAISYFNQSKTTFNQEAGRYVTRPPQSLSPAVISAIEKRIENGYTDVSLPIKVETNAIKDSYILPDGKVDFDKISNEVTTSLMKENINPDAAGGIDIAVSKLFLPLAGALQSAGFKDTGFFTQDQAEVKKAQKAFQALNVQVNSLARETVTGRLFKEDAKNLRNFTKVLEGGIFQNDVTLYDGMIGLRDFVASKYKLAVGIMNNPTDFSQKQIEEARKESKEILQVISELQTGILLFEKRMPGLNPEFGTTQASDAQNKFGSGELIGIGKTRE